MKGMMNFLEKTGFLRATDEAPPTSVDAGTPVPAEAEPALVPALSAGAAAPVESVMSLSLAQIYEQASVPVSAYPAEKLLRLLDGLKAMDEATRRQAIQAMDAADDNWTMEDPIRDAIAKIQALASQGAQLRAGTEQAERETLTLIAQVRERESSSVAEIRRQISELESLLAREVALAEQASAELQAAQQSKRDGVARALDQLNQATINLKRLIAEFGSGTPG